MNKQMTIADMHALHRVLVKKRNATQDAINALHNMNTKFGPNNHAREMLINWKAELIAEGNRMTNLVSMIDDASKPIVAPIHPVVTSKIAPLEHMLERD
jgi:hypothetical protein